MSKLFCILLLSITTGCATVENKNQISANTDFQSTHRSLQVIKPRSNGPYPTVIVGHGCDGLKKNPALLDWARELNSWGYNAVFYDSFESKGVSGDIVCTRYVESVSPAYRAKEAEVAAKWIKEQPWHKGKIGYIGESHGGATAIRIAKEANTESNISAVAAYYPWCQVVALGSITLNKKNSLPYYGQFMNIPTQLHLAEADDWTPSSECKQIQNAEIFEYAGATHAFDLNYPDRKLFGHTLKYDRKATALSRERVKKFLSENL